MASKLMLRIGYTELVMDAPDALKAFHTLADAQVLQKDTRYVKDEAGTRNAVEYVKPFSKQLVLCAVDNAEFAMWKLAGEADE